MRKLANLKTNGGKSHFLAPTQLSLFGNGPTALSVRRSTAVSQLAEPCIAIIDSNAERGQTLGEVLELSGLLFLAFRSLHSFLDNSSNTARVILADMHLPETTPTELLRLLRHRKIRAPVIFVAEKASVEIAVLAMKAGACDVIERPLNFEKLSFSMMNAWNASVKNDQRVAGQSNVLPRLSALTPRERNVLEKIAKGCPNKVAAHELGISTRTVEFHRARLMEKLNARHVSDLIRIAISME